MKKYIYILFFIIIFSSTQIVVAVSTEQFLNPSVEKTSLQDFLVNFYNYSIIISGALALAMIIFGGIYILFSGAMPDKENEGKDIILNALRGLLLLISSYVILKNVNPELVSLRDPGEGIIKNVEYKNCLKPKNVSGGTNVILDCGLYEYPIIDTNGNCSCYVTEMWEKEYQISENNNPESGTLVTCDNPKDGSGKEAGSNVISLGKTYLGKLTYLLGGPVTNGMADCSTFASYLYNCAMKVTMGDSSTIYTMEVSNKLEKKTGNDIDFFKKLKPGDMIGYSADCRCNRAQNCGHIMIVLEVGPNGPTRVLEQGGRCKGKGACESDLGNDRKNKILHKCGVMVHIKGND